MDYEGSTTSWTIEVTVTDSGGLTDSATYTVYLTDVNEEPEFISAVMHRSTYQTAFSEGDKNVGAVIEAIDPDNGDNINFTIHEHTYLDSSSSNPCINQEVFKLKENCQVSCDSLQPPLPQRSLHFHHLNDLNLFASIRTSCTSTSCDC